MAKTASMLVLQTSITKHSVWVTATLAVSACFFVWSGRRG
jgi:hypothetical protein